MITQKAKKVKGFLKKCLKNINPKRQKMLERGETDSKNEKDWHKNVQKRNTPPRFCARGRPF